MKTFTVLVFLVIITGCTTGNQQPGTGRNLLATIRTAAEKGDAQAQSDLGRAFLFGELGLAKNDREAVKWYRKAAEQNYAPAQGALGVCYNHGNGVGEG